LALSGKRILLIIGGGIAAYKSLELIRRLKERAVSVRAILTVAGSQFVTPLSVGSLTGETVHQDLFDLTRESEMGHIVLSRSADLIVVAPATADLMAKLSSGLAPDLASTTLLATDKPVLLAPAMNMRMWNHPATQRNLTALRRDNVMIVGPNDGEMACGEFGPGRMAEPEEIIAAIEKALVSDVRLKGFKAVVTAGPTHEPIDPVRFLANRSSGKQGYAIAAALADAGANTVLVSGPVEIEPPKGPRLVKVETARQMWAACEAELPADIAVCAAAVADWRPASLANAKIKKKDAAPNLALVENPDILATLSRHTKRPSLVIGFAAETDDLIANAKAKLAAKDCDWMVANDVGGHVMGGDSNAVHLLSRSGVEDWPEMPKADVARRLVDRIAQNFGKPAP
jgi:phosphopantothenoylcysteine decarboxylase / phosphopantothenate---cysteine ligase